MGSHNYLITFRPEVLSLGAHRDLVLGTEASSHFLELLMFGVSPVLNVPLSHGVLVVVVKGSPRTLVLQLLSNGDFILLLLLQELV